MIQDVLYNLYPHLVDWDELPKCIYNTPTINHMFLNNSDLIASIKRNGIWPVNNATSPSAEHMPIVCIH